mgnify:CR=1 FL=1
MKRWISILLIASLLLTFLPTGGAAQAETTATTHSHSGWTALSTVSSVGGTLSAGNYYLSSVTNTLSATGSITIDGDVTLCLNGKVLDLRGYAINVRSGDHLTICDCSSATHYGNIGTDGLWQASNSSGNCNLTGGVITSTSSVAGNSSAVSVESGGSLTLVSGNIAGNTAGSYGGGGVFVHGSNSSFTMEGGSIIGNCADKKHGGGVSVASGSFTMNGGSIANNTASGDGGGYGGGVYVTGSDSSFTMNGGSISGNSATQWGGGVSVNGSSFTMEGGSISGNTASSGGGVHVNGSSFTMSSGNITGNHASGVGGGVTLNNTNGTSMTLSGNVGITSNTTANTTAANAPSNVYLPEGRVITIGGPLTGSQNIGVSMAKPGVFTSGLSGKGSFANFTSDDSDYILLSSDGGEAALHAHSYTYSAEDAVITQACTCGHRATATLSAPTDCTYDGQAKTASMQYGDNWQGYQNGNISYKKGGQSVSKVKEAGTYTASVTIDNATASVTFTIEKASQEPPSAGEGYAIGYGNETLTVTNGYEVATAETGGTIVSSGSTIAPGAVLYIRRPGDNNHTPSAWTAFTIPVRPATPAAPTVRGKTDTSITIATESGKAYCISDGNWITGDDNPHTFSGLTAGTAYTITVRVPATTSHFASESASTSVTTKTAAAAAPAAPSDVSVTDSSVTVADSVNGQQYVVVLAGETDIDWSQAQSGNGGALTFENLTPGTVYVVYTRTAETEEAMPSQASSTSVTTAAATPNAGEGYAIDYSNETITVKDGYEVRVENGKWQTETITFAPGTSYEVRKAEANGVPASAAVSFATAARPAAPGDAVTVVNETIQGKGDGALKGITSAMEYKLSDGEWTSGTGDALTNLAAGTTVTVRLKATNAAPHGEEQIYTVEAGKSLTVIFNSNGGSAVASIKDLSYNESITAPIAPTKNGYTFVGWYKDEALNQVWDFSSDTVTADTTLYAKWTANTNTAYTVKHWRQNLDAGSDENAENYTCVDTENGTGTTGASVTPALKNYEGFTAPNAQTVAIAADGSTVVNYYYIRNSYTVSLSADTGIASVSGAGTYAYGAAVTIDAVVEDGYSWQQWSDDNADKRRSFPMGASDVRLTAQATLNEYTITYDLAGGTLPDGDANPDSYTVESAAITLANPTKTGHAFAGWTGTGLDGASETVTIAQGSTGDRGYTATWTANHYAITYEGMDGAEHGDAQPTSHTYGTATTVSDPTKTGYTFAGWLVNGSGEAVKNLTLGADDYTEAITLTATWTANHYTVAFDANGGSGTMAPQAFTYDAAQALAAASFTRAGHTFAGWNTAADGSGTSFADETSVVNLSAEDGASVTLYAQWTEDAKYSLSGQVTESDGTGAAGATVILMQGAEEIAQTTTDSSGCYVFTNIPAGVYNIVTKKDDVTTTTMVTVDADHETTDTIILPEGRKNATVDNSAAGVFAATVGGLNEIANSAQVNDGETVTITLAVTEKEDVTNSSEAEDETLKQEQAAIKQEADGQTLAFLDLSLLKTTTPNSGVASTVDIGDSNDNLLTIVVPFATDNRCHITVYRYHGTAAEALPEGSENAVNGEYFSVGDGVITICAKNFSTYAIGYSNPPSTGGSVGLAPIVTESEHGSVQLSPSRPSIGQTVTITPQPDEGYTVAAVTVTDASGQALTVTKNHDGTWSYEQLRGQVTIAVTFRLASDASDCPQDNSCPLAGYSDLQMHTWYHDCVHYCLENGLMVGTAQGVFSPDTALTRAQAVVILWRNEGSPLVEQPLDFDDVADDDWYADAVRWAVAADVMSGYGNGRFGADDPMTREQMASMFHRFALQKGIAVNEGAAVDLNRFSDADAISSWALDVVQWACDTGLLRGFEDGRLDPTGNTTRAQYSAMIMRFLEDITQ